MTATDRDISEPKAEPTAVPTDQLDELIDDVLGQAETRDLELLGPNGVMKELTKRVFERALEVERSDHLGYEKSAPNGWGSGNNRNGTSPKTLLTDAGTCPLAETTVPRAVTA